MLNLKERDRGNEGKKERRKGRKEGKEKRKERRQEGRRERMNKRMGNLGAVEGGAGVLIHQSCKLVKFWILMLCPFLFWVMIRIISVMQVLKEIWLCRLYMVGPLWLYMVALVSYIFP